MGTVLLSRTTLLASVNKEGGPPAVWYILDQRVTAVQFSGKDHSYHGYLVTCSNDHSKSHRLN